MVSPSNNGCGNFTPSMPRLAMVVPTVMSDTWMPIIRPSVNSEFISGWPHSVSVAQKCASICSGCGLSVMLENSMLSICVTVRVSRCGMVSPTTKSSKYNPPRGCRRSFSVIAVLPISVSELLAQDAFVEAVAGIVQQHQVDAAIHRHPHARHVTKLRVIGHRAHGTFLGFQNLDFDARIIRQKRAAPMPRTKRRDRRQRQKRSIERQDRAVDGEVVGGRAGRRRHQNAVGAELLHAHLRVDADAQF